MTTATLAPKSPPRPATGPAALAGTGTLIRFALRRDRVRLPVWILALLLGTLSTANSYTELYGTPEDRANAVATMGSPAGLAMSGPATTWTTTRTARCSATRCSASWPSSSA